MVTSFLQKFPAPLASCLCWGVNCNLTYLLKSNKLHLVSCRCKLQKNLKWTIKEERNQQYHVWSEILTATKQTLTYEVETVSSYASQVVHTAKIKSIFSTKITFFLFFFSISHTHTLSLCGFQIYLISLLFLLFFLSFTLA